MSHNERVLRDAALVPLSRQHHHALALCVLTERSLRSDPLPETIAMLARKAVDRYDIELTNHFAIEEQVLFPLIERELGQMPAVSELIAGHRALARMIDEMRANPTAAMLEGFCAMLRSHVRREENELFEDIQQRLPAHSLEVAGREIGARAVRVCL